MSSTQDAARARAISGAAEGLAVQALEQTKGRGRHERPWVSERGNLYLSVLLRPGCDARLIGQTGLVAGLAVAETVRELTGQAPLLKWPNDVLLESGKCAGILVESEISKHGVEWAVLGIGVNIASAPPGIGAVLSGKAGKPVNINDFRDFLLKNLGLEYGLWRREGFGAIRSRWMNFATAPGTVLSVKTPGSATEGAFEGIDEEGNLLLGGKVIAAGDVYLKE
ncbi:MAG: biotin--[acetyl-CoA-carboxylase] ligase [Alphaproteobacteria bacterium]|nr:biotin--[acetyl-CoA-carboxylase] ligase [Alphaproteobacteria bacterium]